MQEATPVRVNEDERRRRVESLAREILALRAKGDAPGLAQRLAPDFAYRTRGAWPMRPFYGGPTRSLGSTPNTKSSGRISMNS